MGKFLVIEENKDQLDKSKITSTRNDLQIGRRLFHIIGGLGIWAIYCFIMPKDFLVVFLGVLVGGVYIMEQLRLNYPEYAKYFDAMASWFLRVEEKFNINAMLPFVISCLLVIIIFPRPVALSAILILAVGDPIGAIVGITYGKRIITQKKTLEGTIAMAVTGIVATYLVLGFTLGFDLKIIFVSILGGIAGALVEIAPIRLDDNITIPLFSSAIIWLSMLAMGV